jgi:large subunit ribosomal protein L23
MKTSAEILLKPISTEKLTAQEEPLNRYGFVVARSANKIQIKKAVEEMYGVTVDSVNTMRYAGKNKSRFTKAGVIAGRGNHFKKAMITLKKGDKIDFYSSI